MKRAIAFSQTALAIGLACLLVTPGAAEVAGRSDTGFTVTGSATVGATPEQTWRTLVTPAQWWIKDHTWSGNSANMSIDPRPGGCFCETLPTAKGAAKGVRSGGVEHMRVIFAQPGKLLRMNGALGPLQSEAVGATLSVELEPAGGGTRIKWTYTAGGYMRFKTETIAPAVDHVLSGQFASLAARLGGALPPG